MKLLLPIATVLGTISATFSVTTAAEAETLRVGMTCTYFPYNFREPSGAVTGYDADVVVEVARRIGADVEFVCQSFDGLIPALLGNKFDLIASAMSITKSRQEQIDFSYPYRVAAGRFVGRSDANLKLYNDDGTPNLDGFKGARIGVPRASTYEKWLNETMPGVNVLLYDGPEALFLDLKSGRLDAIMTSPLTAHLSFLDTPDGADYEFVSPPINAVEYFGTGVGIGMRKGNDDLLAQIDEALKQMISDGTLREFGLKYFPFAIHPEEWEEIKSN